MLSHSPPYFFEVESIPEPRATVFQLDRQLASHSKQATMNPGISFHLSAVVMGHAGLYLARAGVQSQVLLRV